MTTFEILEEYVHSQRAAIDQGIPIVVEVRDTDTFERFTVKARLLPPGAGEEDADQLVLRDLAENVAADDWKIVVLEEVDPDSTDISPQSDYRKSAPDGR
jgi:hypothetical protein